MNSATPDRNREDAPPPATPLKECLRCHQRRELDDDGFCDDCRRALEAACL